MRYEIRDCLLADLREIAPQLREADRAEILAVCPKPRRLLQELWRQSYMRRAARVDGEIAAVWGCAGALLSGDGSPWLFTAPAIEKVPLAFFRQARAEIAELLVTKTRLETGVLRSYARSIRFWEMVGFARAGEYDLGGHTFLKLQLERS